MEEKIQDNILFLGNRDDVNRIYQAMDVFVLPSRYEGLPVVAVEAQASGLPCVLSDKITNEVQITHFAIFKNIGQSPDDWADAIEKTAEQTEYVGSRGTAHPEMENAGLSIEKQGEKLQEYYELLLHREMESG